MQLNPLALKLNYAYDVLVGDVDPQKKIDPKADKSLRIFNSLVYALGMLLIIAAVVLVFKNFGIWPLPPLKDVKCEDGLYIVGTTAAGVLVLLCVGLTLVQGTIEKGEVRKSIAISVLLMYYGLIAIHCVDKIDKDSVLGMTLDHYWAIVTAITGYYFATRAYEEAKKPK